MATKERKFTKQEWLSWDPCYPHNAWEKHAGRKRKMSVSDMLALRIPWKDRLWTVLRPQLFTAKELHEIAVRAAELILPRFEKLAPYDDRLRRAIELKKQWNAGKSTPKTRACRNLANQAFLDHGGISGSLASTIDDAMVVVAGHSSKDYKDGFARSTAIRVLGRAYNRHNITAKRLSQIIIDVMKGK